MADKSYDTPLTPEEMKAYQAWGRQQAALIGRDPTQDVGDYDMQGFFKENGPVDLRAGAHFTDKFKKPNHPTFSTQSQYSTADTPGGRWVKQSDGTWVFVPSATNFKYRSPAELQDYFQRVEPGNRLEITDAARKMFPNSQHD